MKRTRQPRTNYSAAWRKQKEERKARRAHLTAQPRNELGFIIVKLADGTSGLKFDTERARTDAQIKKELSNEVAKTAKTRSRPKKRETAA